LGAGCCQQAAFAQAVHQPVVKRALVFKLQRADAVGDLLQRVFNRVGKGVHRVDAPFVAGVVVGGAADAVDGRVAHVDVGAGHVDFGTQNHSAIGMLSLRHLPETFQILGRGAGAVGAVHAGLAKVAPVGAHLLGGLFVHIGVAGFDQVFRCAVHEVEVVAGLVQVADTMGVPVKTQPLHRVQNAVDVFGVFFFGVGVVKAHVAHATVVARQAKVQANAFGMAHVQVAIGLGWETGADFGRVGRASGVVGGVAGAASPAALGVSAVFQIVFDDLAQKIAGFDGVSGCVVGGAGVGRWGGVAHAADFRGAPPRNRPGPHVLGAGVGLGVAPVPYLSIPFATPFFRIAPCQIVLFLQPPMTRHPPRWLCCTSQT
jgi:hypothetical protein